jgi:hypothetical protein
MSAPVNTLETMPAAKLLHYVTKSELQQFLTPAKYIQVEQHVRQQLNKERISVREVKQYLVTRGDVMEALRKSDFGLNAFRKHKLTSERLQNMDNRAQMQNVRRIMKKPRNRFRGCIAAKTPQETYQQCLVEYNQPKFDNLSLVPTELRNRVYQNGDAQTRALLATSIAKQSLSDLPAGLTRYMKANPHEFRELYENRRIELAMMRSVLKNLTATERDALNRYYKDNKRIDARALSSIISDTASVTSSSTSSSSSSSSASKRPRENLNVTGGCDKGAACTCDVKKGGDYGDDDDWSDTSSVASMMTSFSSLLQK